MTTAAKATHRPKIDITRRATDIVRLRRDCEDAIVDASQAERRALRESIAVLDRIVSLQIEAATIIDSGLRKLADRKLRNRV